jgi:L-aminopeptidase/D-esterase-like protein
VSSTRRSPNDQLPFGSITDVDGITVGHFQRTGRGWQTGTTVVITKGGATPGVIVLRSRREPAGVCLPGRLGS